MRSIKVESAKSTIESTDFIVVYFWKISSAPCKTLIPLLEKVESELNITIHKVCVEDDAQQFDVHVLPALKIFKDGKCVDKIYGAKSIDVYIDAIKPFIP